MTENIVVAVIGAVPALAALLFLGLVVLLNRSELRTLLSRISKLTVAGIEVELDTEALKEARPDAAVSEAAADVLAARIARNRDSVLGRRVLWVDDHPRYNDLERAFLRSAGVFVHNAVSTEDAMGELARDQYDVAITDQDRGAGDDGERFAEAALARYPSLPVVAYIGKVSPDRSTPAVFRGLTDRPDELMHLLLDVFERKEA